MSLLAICYPAISKIDFDCIQSLRDKYDNEGYKVLDAHLTFVFPTEKINQTDFQNHIRPIINSFPKIDFELTHFKLSAKPFEGDWFIFLSPEKGRDKITELHDLLYSDMLSPELSSIYKFDPHITIGRLENKNQCLDIIDNLNKDNYSIKGQIQSIDIATYENNCIKTIEKIKLKIGISSDSDS